MSRSRRPTLPSDGPVQIEYKVSDGGLETELQTAFFDEIILAIDADSALHLLGKEATWMERRVLGSVKYLYDVTITHNDVDYMKKVCTGTLFGPSCLTVLRTVL